MEILLKLSAIIAIFYLCYVLLLKNDTFFQSNRWFLNFGMISAILIPFITIPIYVTKQVSSIPAVNLGASGTAANNIPEAVAFDWSSGLLFIYMSGVLVMGMLFLFRLASLCYLIISNPKRKDGSFILVAVKDKVSPFSFFNYIVYREDQFSEEEFKQVLAHEKVHANQWHSIDILLSNFLIILNWFNPMAWLFKKQLEQNLEFIADQEAQQLSGCGKSYQQLILKSTVPNYQMVLANNFYNSLIKKRIIMLHKNRSNRLNQLKLLTVIPLLAFFMMSFSTKEIIDYEFLNSPDTSQSATDKLQDETVIVIDKNTSKQDFEDLSKEMKAKGITLKFKGIKRNSNDEITSIEISAKTGRSTTTYEAFDDVAIDPITIRIKEDGGISISDGKEHRHKEDYHFSTKDGKHKVHSKKAGTNVWIESDDEEGATEVIHEDDKVIIKKGDKIKEVKVKGGKGVNVFFSDDDEEGDVEIIETEGEDGESILIRKSKDGKVSKEKIKKVKKSKGSGGIFIHSDSDKEEDENIFIMNEGDSEFFFEGSNESLLYIIDGKESTKKAAEKLKSEDIESINVMKGKAAEKKYGKKAKDGVVEITTKKN